MHAVALVDAILEKHHIAYKYIHNYSFKLRNVTSFRDQGLCHIDPAGD